MVAFRTLYECTSGSQSAARWRTSSARSGNLKQPQISVVLAGYRQAPHLPENPRRLTRKSVAWNIAGDAWTIRSSLPSTYGANTNHGTRTTPCGLAEER